MQESLIETFLDGFGEDDAVAEARRQLEAFGLDDWTARVAEPFPDELACATLGVEPDGEVVFLVGIPPHGF